MLCRHFCHVLPRAVISSVFASPSSWSSGELQRFSARCEETMPATGIRDALPSPPDSHRLSWPIKSFRRSTVPTSGTPFSWPPMQKAASCAGQQHGQGFCNPNVPSRQIFIEPLSARASCKAVSWNQAGTLESSMGWDWECLGRMHLGWDSCISSLSLAP